MDMGALTVFLHTFNEQEKIYNLIEALTGARLTQVIHELAGCLGICLKIGLMNSQGLIRKFHAISEADQLQLEIRFFWIEPRTLVLFKRKAIDFCLSDQT